MWLVCDPIWYFPCPLVPPAKGRPDMRFLEKFLKLGGRGWSKWQKPRLEFHMDPISREWRSYSESNWEETVWIGTRVDAERWSYRDPGSTTRSVKHWLAIVLVGSEIDLVSGMGKICNTWKCKYDWGGKESLFDEFLGSCICFPIKAISM